VDGGRAQDGRVREGARHQRVTKLAGMSRRRARTIPC
jgi:hypothetical protein